MKDKLHIVALTVVKEYVFIYEIEGEKDREQAIKKAKRVFESGKETSESYFVGEEIKEVEVSEVDDETL